MFSRLGITAELLNQARIERVTDREAREKYGIVGYGDMSGIVFPYMDPMTGHRWTGRVRRDNAEVEDGKAKRKYVSAYGDHRHFFFPPGCGELLADASVDLIFVEAEKSVLALTAWSIRTGRKILPVGLGGCWGWRGRIGRVESPNGERVDEVGPIADLRWANNGRKTYVLLDANASTNPKVRQARAALVRQLRKQGADVVVPELPLVEGVNGPDDFIGERGDEAMLQILEGAESGSAILNDVALFIRRFVILSSAQVTAVTLWCAHTYAYLIAIWTAYLAITSAEKRCAKSRLLETVGYLVSSPWATADITAAALFRGIEKKRPTLLLDEQDAAKKGDKEKFENLRAVLNAGAHYKGRVTRCVGKGSEQDVKDFTAFCPKAIAGIGWLADTVADRSIPIRMKRKLVSEKVERLHERTVEPIAAPLRKRLSDWIRQQLPALKDAEPDIPEQLNDRQQDGAECLLAIADAAGGDWPEKARKALIELYTGDASEDQSLPTLLLADIRDIFDRLQSAMALSSAELIEELKKIEHGIWAEYHQEKPIGTRALSKLLGGFGIGPQGVRRGEKTPKGYRKESFIEAWERYVPLSPLPHPQHAPQANVYAGETHISDPQHEWFVADEKSEESPMFMRGVADVADKSGSRGTQAQEEEHMEGVI